MQFAVTLADLRKAGACYRGYNRVVRSLQGKPFSADDANRESYIRFAHKAPVPLTSILESNGLDDATWSLRCVQNVDRDARLFAVWCARQVQHLMTDERSIAALDVAERRANGLATDNELGAARDAAWDAAMDAAMDAALDAARAAARAAAWDAARAAARDAARDAARGAARDAAWAAAGSAAGSAARDAAWGAARDAAWDAQATHLREVIAWEDVEKSIARYQKEKTA